MSDTQTQGEGGGAFDLSQFHGVFFEEAGENLANMETLLLAIDESSADDESLNAIFRCAHSIKGGAATFGFQNVADLTHVMETLLDKLRRHELGITVGMIDTLLESGDVLKHLLAGHQGHTGEATDCSELVARIGALSSGVAAAPPVPQAAPAVAPAPAKGERVLDVAIGPMEQPQLADHLADLFAEIPGLGTFEPTDGGRADAERIRRFRVVTVVPDGELLDLFSFHVAREQIRIVSVTPDAPSAPATAPPASDARGEPAYGFFDSLPAPAAAPAAPAAAAIPAAAIPAAPAPAAPSRTPAPPAAASAPRPGKPAERPPAASGSPENSTIRVPVEKVDQLINLVGELVITQAMLAQTGQALDPVVHQAMATALTDLERNTRMLQESVMAIRMIPMGMVFNRFPRMLRDLAAKLGKQVELQTIGEDTELDKGLIEKITDPLTHLVRNAADHGIELPQVRLAAGKPAMGTVTLAAAHQGGSIVIEVRDDGRGLNRDKLLAKAMERGLPLRDQMTDQEVFALIFEPGFSTAAEVTDVSGGASAWTWSSATSPASAARSRSTRPRATACASRCASP
jgi:two-component system chemotaxis sensor kinase CheA